MWTVCLRISAPFILSPEPHSVSPLFLRHLASVCGLLGGCRIGIILILPLSSTRTVCGQYFSFHTWLEASTTWSICVKQTMSFFFFFLFFGQVMGYLWVQIPCWKHCPCVSHSEAIVVSFSFCWSYPIAYSLSCNCLSLRSLFEMLSKCVLPWKRAEIIRYCITSQPERMYCHWILPLLCLDQWSVPAGAA